MSQSLTLSGDTQSYPVLYSLQSLEESSFLPGDSSDSIRKRCAKTFRSVLRGLPVPPGSSGTRFLKSSSYKLLELLASGEAPVSDIGRFVPAAQMLLNLFEESELVFDKDRFIVSFCDVFAPCGDIDGIRTLCWHVTKHILEYDLSAAGFANRVGMGSGWVSRLATGYATVNKNSPELLADILGFSVTDIEKMMNFGLVQAIAATIDGSGVGSTLRDLVAQSVLDSDMPLADWCSQNNLPRRTAERIINNGALPKSNDEMETLCRVLNITTAEYAAAGRLLLLEGAIDESSPCIPIVFRNRVQLLLDEELESNDWDHGQLAEAIGVSASTIRNILSVPHLLPRHNIRFALCAYFDLSFSEITNSFRAFTCGREIVDEIIAGIQDMNLVELGLVQTKVMDLIEERD